MLFSDNWCQIDKFDEDFYHIYPSITLEDIKNIEQLSLSSIINNATRKIVKIVGNNPAICLSGGIDSQAMALLWDKTYPCSIVLFQFENNYNKEDVDSALAFIEKYKLKHRIITLNIQYFLNNLSIKYAKTYNMSSPQFAVHAYFLQEVKRLGYTGAVCGGNSFVISKDLVAFFCTSAQLYDIKKWGDIELPTIPNFLSFEKNLCIKIALSSPICEEITHESRYLNKIQNYRNLGLDIIPQDGKRTGFEYFKKFYNSSRYEGAFEIDYRLPMYRINKNLDTKTILPMEVTDYFIKNALLQTDSTASISSGV